MKTGEKDITVRERPSIYVTFMSQYGPTSWAQWLALEVARCAGHGRKVRIDENEKGELALVDQASP